MGQYRQWLHYREVDQQLRAQQELLTQEVKRLQEQINLSETPLLNTGNAIIQALILYAAVPPADLPLPPQETNSENGHASVQPEIIPQALFDRSRLPDLDPLDAQIAQSSVPPMPVTNAYAPLPPIPHADMNLLPEDMAALFNAHSQTDPQLTLPWWLHKAAISATQGGPLDQQSIRTNRLVQRWLERWGRQSEQSGHPPPVRPIPSDQAARPRGKQQEDKTQ